MRNLLHKLGIHWPAQGPDGEGIMNFNICRICLKKSYDEYEHGTLIRRVRWDRGVDYRKHENNS